MIVQLARQKVDTFSDIRCALCALPASMTTTNINLVSRPVQRLSYFSTAMPRTKSVQYYSSSDEVDGPFMCQKWMANIAIWP